MTELHNQPTEESGSAEVPVKKTRSAKKRDSSDGHEDEKPLVLDLANAKWMVK